MVDPKVPSNFLRKVARFVANPTTDWAELTSAAEAQATGVYAKHELKVMVERKRRNDFVRKREFDMLRKIRRDGMIGADLGAGASNLDSDPRSVELAKPDREVKAKIDAIEQQMVGESLRRHAINQNQSHSPAFYNATTQPVSLVDALDSIKSSYEKQPVPVLSTELLRAPPATTQSTFSPELQTRPQATPTVNSASLYQAESVMRKPPFAETLGLDVTEAIHDPELDEAVIAFANADFDQCEKCLMELIQQDGKRYHHAETWLVLFDLYRATDQQLKFEPLAMEFAEHFGQSAPQWFSLPKQVAQYTAQQELNNKTKLPPTLHTPSSIGWSCPDCLDETALSELRSQLLQMPLPWALDWSHLSHIEPQACHQLTLILRGWALTPYEMRWTGVAHLLHILQEYSPSGTKDTDPAYWLLRLEVLRLLGQNDQFDEIAIEYCVTYEVSPPSWESVECQVFTADYPAITNTPELSQISEVSTSFVESNYHDDYNLLEVASLDLSGQLVGDISHVLSALEKSLGEANLLHIACTYLIRVDFIAAGDLLNWVLHRRSENRTVYFEETNRLIALFFGAMGINEHARVRLRNV